MPTSETTEGTILRMVSLGEADRLVDVLTPDRGRLVLLAKNARKSRRRFGGALDLMTTCTMGLRVGGRRIGLEQIQRPKIRHHIRTDLTAFSRGMRMLECVLVAMGEEEPASQPFALLNEALDWLDTGRVAEASAFFPRLLMHAGFFPELDNCPGCGNISPEFFARPGVLACRHCLPGARRVPDDVLAVLRGEALPHAAETARQVEAFCLQWLSRHADISLRTDCVALSPTSRARSR